ncbi:MAG: hypothetical protein R3C19_27245 [Planctomycetaceae bacterium]
MKDNRNAGVISVHEAYSKHSVLQRLGISQKFWDRMLDDGLPYTVIGHSRWVTGQDLIEHLSRNAERKQPCTQQKGEPHAEATRNRQRAVVSQPSFAPL